MAPRRWQRGARVRRSSDGGRGPGGTAGLVVTKQVSAQVKASKHLIKHLKASTFHSFKLQTPIRPETHMGTCMLAKHRTRLGLFP